MTTRELAKTVAEILKSKGYIAQNDVLNKNGIMRDAVIVKKEETDVVGVNICIKNEDLSIPIDELVNIVIKSYENGINNMPGIFDLDKLTNPDRAFLEEKLSVKMVKRGIYDAITRPCEELSDVDMLLCIAGKDYNAYVKHNILKVAGVTEEEAWEMAIKNICSDTVFKGMKTVLAELQGIPEELIPDYPFTIVSNSRCLNGANVLLNKEGLKEYARQRGWNSFYIVPSSVHEIMLLSADDMEMGVEELKMMVRDINATELAYEEVLSNQICLMTVA